MSWTFAPKFDAAHRAAVETGNPLIYEGPPAGWGVRPLFEQIPACASPGLATLVLAPDLPTADDLVVEARACRDLEPVHQASGLARTRQRLGAQRVGTLVASPSEIMQLLEQGGLGLDRIQRVVVCWPEHHARLGATGHLDTILGECGQAQRFVVTADAGGVSEFMTRHARRAPTLATTTLPVAPTTPARYAVVGRPHLVATVRAALDTLCPTSVLIWDPTAATARWSDYRAEDGISIGHDVGTQQVDLVIGTEVPTVEALRAMHEIAGRVILFVRPWQQAYLRRIAAPLTAIHVDAEVDRARDARARLRAAVRERIEGGGTEDSLLALAPLLDEHDPALVAAALLAMRDTADTSGPSLPEGVPLWVHVRLSIGRREGLRPGDVVGALLNAAGLAKDDVGRVDLRENFTVVEVRAEAADAARRGLDGLSLKGRSVSARFDRK